MNRSETVAIEPCGLHRWRALMGCCDCGLMHVYEFEIDRQGRLLVTGERDVSATDAMRRDRAFAFGPRPAMAHQPKA